MSIQWPEVWFKCFPELWTRLRSGSNFASWWNLSITTEHVQTLSATGSQLAIFINFALFYTWIKFFPNFETELQSGSNFGSGPNLSITTEHIQLLSVTSSQVAIFTTFKLFYTLIMGQRRTHKHKQLNMEIEPNDLLGEECKVELGVIRNANGRAKHIRTAHTVNKWPKTTASTRGTQVDTKEPLTLPLEEKKKKMQVVAHVMKSIALFVLNWTTGCLCDDGNFLATFRQSSKCNSWMWIWHWHNINLSMWLGSCDLPLWRVLLSCTDMQGVYFG